MGDYSDTSRRDRFRSIYSSDLGDDIVNDFFVPALTDATEYRRVTGDFSSRFLVAAAQGLGPFFLKGGRMWLVTNGRFSEEDEKAIETGTAVEKVLEDSLSKEIEAMKDLVAEFELDHIRALVWLLKTGRLEIRVSLLKDDTGRILAASNPKGTQHSKVGVIHNKHGETIGFIGGLNESLRAYLGNAETLKAFYSWKESNAEDIVTIRSIFDSLWENRSPKSVTLKFPEACAKRLIEIIHVEEPPSLGPAARLPQASSGQPSWKHQDDAIAKFLSARNGILEMATGTGKTRTALRIAKTLLERGDIQGVVVATKWNDLLDQWHREMIGFFGPSALLIYRHYGIHKEMDTFLETLSAGPSALLTSYENLPGLLRRDRNSRIGTCLLICDEIHNAGSAGNVKALSGRLGHITWRLGLSATPERIYDPDGTAFIDEEIGPVIFRFSLEDAIRAGILCEFDYVPLSYEFSEEDRDKVRAAYARFHARKLSGELVPIEELYLELSRVRKLSQQKLPVFRNYLSSNLSLLKRCLIFVETKEYGHLVQEIIHTVTMDYHTYYGDDESENLRRFSRGDLDCLITCKRIAEGVDIRSVSNIVLFSASRARLETIQRIGRALRVSPDLPDKRSRVVDFIREGDLHPSGETDEFEPVDGLRFNWLLSLSNVHRQAVGEGDSNAR